MRNDQDVNLAAQTGEVLQYVADLQDISTEHPERRQVDDAGIAAKLLIRELESRLAAVLESHSGQPIVLLSGGVDSIAVAAAAVRLGARPHAITVVTDGATDAASATAAAAALGLTHELIELTSPQLAELAREAISRLEISELWEVSYAIPLLAVAESLDRLPSVGPILTGAGADAILGGGKTIQNPITSAAAVEEIDRIIRKESAANFRRERLVPDFYERVIPQYADRFVLLFQTERFWSLCETFAPAALFGTRYGQAVDKLCLRLACEQLLPGESGSLAWAKKSAIQRSAGIMGALAAAARTRAAAEPAAQTYTDPMSEDWESVATRLFLALLNAERS
ncbi:asparagine synthase-related protein [Nocardia testacea]|uniref:asparagine synthase-related protein n=1 Tax=Nocardia testacea TaxID=248551 RepID=UPI0033D1243C